MTMQVRIIRIIRLMQKQMILLIQMQTVDTEMIMAQTGMMMMRKMTIRMKMQNYKTWSFIQIKKENEFIQ